MYSRRDALVEVSINARASRKSSNLQADLEATAIRVAVERIDYWEPPTSRIVRLMQAVKAVLTRQAVDTPRKTLDGFVND